MSVSVRTSLVPAVKRLRDYIASAQIIMAEAETKPEMADQLGKLMVKFRNTMNHISNLDNKWTKYIRSLGGDARTAENELFMNFKLDGIHFNEYMDIASELELEINMLLADESIIGKTQNGIREILGRFDLNRSPRNETGTPLIPNEAVECIQRLSSCSSQAPRQLHYDYGQKGNDRKSGGGGESARDFAIQAMEKEANSSKGDLACFFCGESHLAGNGEKVTACPRMQMQSEQDIFLICLRVGQAKAACQSRMVCTFCQDDYHKIICPKNGPLFNRESGGVWEISCESPEPKKGKANELTEEGAHAGMVSLMTADVQWKTGPGGSGGCSRPAAVLTFKFVSEEMVREFSLKKVGKWDLDVYPFLVKEPVKILKSIPRMELLAARIAVGSAKIGSEIEENITQRLSDSKSVLGRIINGNKLESIVGNQFHIMMGEMIGHSHSEMNVGCVTTGLDPATVAQGEQWWEGLFWMAEATDQWRSGLNFAAGEAEETLNEDVGAAAEKATLLMSVQAAAAQPFDFGKWNKWEKMMLAMATVEKASNAWLRKIGQSPRGELTKSELIVAGGKFSFTNDTGIPRVLMGIRWFSLFNPMFKGYRFLIGMSISLLLAALGGSEAGKDCPSDEPLRNWEMMVWFNNGEVISAKKEDFANEGKNRATGLEYWIIGIWLLLCHPSHGRYYPGTAFG